MPFMRAPNCATGPLVGKRNFNSSTGARVLPSASTAQTGGRPMTPRLFHRPRLEDRTDSEPGMMGFLDHLEELRKRLIRSCIAIALGMAASAMFIDRIANFVLNQILRTLPANSALIYTNPSDGFAFWFNITLIAGLVLAAP